MFLANYADVLTNAPLPDMIERFGASGAVASLLAVPPQSSHHVVDIGEDGIITQVTPMQDLRQWENGGYFLLRPDIFEHLQEGEDLVEDALMRRLVPQGRVLAYAYKGYWSPADTVKERAQLEEMYQRGNCPWMIWDPERSGIATPVNSPSAGIGAGPAVPLRAQASNFIAAASGGASAVPRRHGGHGKRPRDGQLGVIEGNRYVLRRVVRAIDAVGDVCRAGEGLKPVRAAGRYVERHLFVVAQFKALPVAVRRRRGPQVNDHVEDRAVRASHELRLSVPAPDVQAPHHAARRAGETVLSERGRVDAGRVHHVRVEGAAEEAALVHVRGRLEQERSGNARNRADDHEASIRVVADIGRTADSLL